MNKRILPLLLAALLLIACADAADHGSASNTQSVGDVLAARASEAPAIETYPEEAYDAPAIPIPAIGDVDIDLMQMSSTMVYSQVYDMITDPASYLGKTVRMHGTFDVFEGETRNYYACVIADATACCAQGIEFVTRDDRIYPDEYPALYDEITVTGVFDAYWEGEAMYLQLIDATLLF